MNGVSIKYLDVYGRTATRRYRTVDQTNLADANDVAELVVGAVSDLILGGIILARKWRREVYAGALTGLANLDEGATFNCDLGGGTWGFVKLPAPKKSNYVLADGSVDMANADVAAFAALFTGAAPRFVVSDGEAVLAIPSGKLDT